MNQKNEKSIRRAFKKQQIEAQKKQGELIRAFLVSTGKYSLRYRLMIALNVVFKRYKK